MSPRTDELAASLDARVAELARGLEPGALAVSTYDYLSGFTWNFEGSRWFHAASTIKLAVLAALYEAVATGRFGLDNRLHVRNRFLSAAGGAPFRVDASRDADADVYASIGRTMRIADLAHHMIASSSNLATNLLLDLIGLDEARRTLDRRRIEGVALRRGVEDDRAFEVALNNEVTADGAARLMRAIHDGDGYPRELSQGMLEILFAQQFSGGIAPGLPDPIRAVARVAHKTGDISTVSHDVGAVFLPGRPPYVVAILTEGGDAARRTAALAEVSRAVYDTVSTLGEVTWK